MTDRAWAYLRRVWCCLFHHNHKDWRPVHHSWDFRCRKCGLEGTVYD